jgi:hypothetical protein
MTPREVTSSAQVTNVLVSWSRCRNERFCQAPRLDMFFAGDRPISFLDPPIGSPQDYGKQVDGVSVSLALLC